MHSQTSNKDYYKTNGVLVQLVRIHACHAWGHGFESRTHRNNYQNGTLTEWLGSGLQNRVQQFESAGYLTRATKFFLVALFYFRLKFFNPQKEFLTIPKTFRYHTESIPSSKYRSTIFKKVSKKMLRIIVLAQHFLLTTEYVSFPVQFFSDVYAYTQKG